MIGVGAEVRTRIAGISGLLVLAALSAPLAGADADAGAGAGAKSRRVVEVRVSGNTRMTRKAVLARVRTQVGQDYDAKTIALDRQRLLRTGRFAAVEISKDTTDRGVVVTVVVIEYDLVAKITFKGNKEFDAKELLKEIRLTVGGALDVFGVGAAERAIRLKYRDAGYYFATVSHDRKLVKERREVVFTIVEGPDVCIRSMNFEGITYFNACQREWMAWFTLRASDKPWWWLLPSGTLKDDDIEQDVITIRKRYVDEGFLGVEVSRKLTFSEDKADVSLTYLVRENKRYYVNEVIFIFKGDDVFSSGELARRTKLKRGDIVKAEAVATDVEILRRTYGQLGYVDVDVEASTPYPPPGAELPAWARDIDDEYGVALVNLVFTIQEGQQSRVGRIDVQPGSAYDFGLSVTQRRVALRQMTLFPRQLFNISAAKTSEERILDTRVFSRATIKHIDPVDPIFRDFGNVHDAMVEATEGKTANFTIGVGVNTNSGLVGEISYAQRNFDAANWPRSWREIIRGYAWKGAGQTIRISARPGTRVSQFNINWTEPSLRDKPYRLSVQAFIWQRYQETYDEHRSGVGASVGHRFKNGWYVEGATRSEVVGVVDVDIDAPSQVRRLHGDTFLQSFKASLIRNRTDSRWKPSRGDVFTLRAEQFVGDFNFQKVSAEYRIYQTLHMDTFDRKYILSVKASVGQVIGYAPTFERYYGGGVGSIRGFRYRGIGPRSPIVEEPIGGDFTAYVGAEYSYPLAGDQLRGVVFIDSGTVDQDAAFDTWRVSTGVGIRWAIPAMGSVPISLDVGIPLIKDEKDDLRAVSFTLGWMF